MRTKLKILLGLLICLSISCKDQTVSKLSKKNVTTSSSTTENIEFSAIEIQTKRNKVIPPRIKKAGLPKKVRAYQNTQRVVFSPPIVIESNVRLDYEVKKIEITTQETPVHYPSSVEVKEPSFKDNAIYNIRFWDVKHGLNSSFIHAIHQDKEGYLWFGGWADGICRFDGRSFLSFGKEQGLAKDVVNVIYEDKKGHFWIGTKSGIVKYDGYNFTDYQGIESEVLSVLQDSKGRIIFTTDDGVIWLENDAFYTLVPKDVPSFFTTSVKENKEGSIWFGGEYGLCLWEESHLTYWTQRDGFNSEDVLDMLLAKDGRLWLATSNGIWIYDGTSFRIIDAVADKQINKIIQDREGSIWFGTFQNGVYRYKNQQLYNYSEREGLSNNEVTALFEDNKGHIWAGTHSAGINQLNPNSFVNLTKNEGLSSNKFNCFITDHEGNTWMATEHNGAIKYDGEYYYHYTKEQGLGSNQIQYLFQDQSKNIWFASYAEGLTKFDGENFTHFTTENGLCGDIVWSIIEDQQGTLWISTEEGGLCRFNGEAFISYEGENGTMISNGLHSIITKEGHMWFSNLEDLFKYDGKTFYRVHRASDESISGIFYFFEDATNRLWLASSDGFLVVDGKDVSHFTQKDGLSDNEVWSFNQDFKNNIWIGTEKGLNLLEIDAKSSNNSFQFKHFQEIDGLKTQDNILYATYLKNNTMWWGMGKNLLQLDLNQFYDHIDTTAPTTFLNSIQMNNQFIDFSGTNTATFSEGKITYEGRPRFQNYPNELVLSHQVNHLTFNFAGLEWSAPHDVEYRYWMEGIDKEWSISTKDHEIDYRSLPYGKYTFKVQAKGKWSDWGKPLKYSFKIRPPWWFTWWAYVIYTLLFCAFIYGIFQFLRRRLQLQNQLELEKEEAQRLKELDHFKSKLYTNLTHEFRTPLTVILGMVQQIRNEPKQFLESGTQLIERNGKSLLRLINQLLDLSKLEDNSFQLHLQRADIIPYLRYLTESFQTYANSQNLSLQFFSTIEKLQMDHDPEQLQQVMSNLISNAVKYTPSGGAIRVIVAREEQKLLLKIEDTGIGIAEEDLPHIFDRFYQIDNSTTRKGEGTGIGLAHMRELVKLMGGTIHVESEVGKGSIFIIQLPIVVSDELEIRNNEWTKAPEVVSINNVQLLSSEQHSILETQNSKLPQLLLIEDNPDVVTYLKTCLEYQYQIDVAYNGKIGIEKALENVPDLIISDVMMPEKDGYEVCDTLKNDERTSHIPITLLTAKADGASKIVGLRRGADAYLSKPFDKEELLVRLEMMIEKQQKLAAYFGQSLTLVTTTPPEEEDIKMEHEFIQKVRSIVENNYTNDRFGLPQLCQKVGMSRSQLYRKMKALINTSPSDFIRTYRLQKAKKLLETTELNVSEVAWEVGFMSLPHFSKIFHEEFGVAPSMLD